MQVDWRLLLLALDQLRLAGRKAVLDRILDRAATDRGATAFLVLLLALDQLRLAGEGAQC